jgi:hypothetical protein
MFARSPTVTWPARHTLLDSSTPVPSAQSCPTCEPASNQQPSPMTVAPPLVPVLIVTDSRRTQCAPMCSAPPRAGMCFLSC